jgi:hypothetical protein
MGACEECREFFRKAMRIEALLDELPVPGPMRLAPPVTGLETQRSKILHTIFPYRQFRDARIPLSVAAAALLVVIAGTIALSSFYMRPRPESGGNSARIVYSCSLPTVYIQAPQNVQH